MGFSLQEPTGLASCKLAYLLNWELLSPLPLIYAEEGYRYHTETGFCEATGTTYLENSFTEEEG